MPGSAARIRVTERQLEVLQDIAHSRTAPLRLVQRATLIFRAFDRIDNQDIAAEIDLNRNAIGLWRRRWAEAWEPHQSSNARGPKPTCVGPSRTC